MGPYLVKEGCDQPDRMGIRDWAPDSSLLRGLLQHLLPPPQAGHDCYPRFQCWCHGELGPYNLQGECSSIPARQVLSAQPRNQLTCDICTDIMTDLDNFITSDTTEQ